MGKIESSTTSREIIVKRGIHGAQSRLKLINESNEVIDSEDILITIDSPEGIFVEIGQSIEIDSGVFQPTLDIGRGRTLNLPIIIEVGIGRDIDHEEIDITVHLDDKDVAEDRIRITA
ncbi:hypothetical protein HTZ84_09375 [Haloterrigena sp. SYSU A558-1]|uniref:Uncharacterized protein n=1 Tax=Haloterrigena gelatinilytica TaxID=2741724 RepID=A0ABX2LAU0_9EURY|nr:hypothetical protein [Haloterrigena gelatinilytica]NUC72515.1 hypothetical protein [Haloterrigena gelatinilytica]